MGFSPWAALALNAMLFLLCLALFRKAKDGIRAMMDRLRTAARWMRDRLRLNAQRAD